MKGYAIPKKHKILKYANFKPTGNVVPLEWYLYIKRESGKPHDVAIMILADIVYWYRPILSRDEATGALLPPRKKFKADMLQRSYSAFEDLYGFTRNQVKSAFAMLEGLDLVKRDFREIRAGDKMLSNVMYIDLNIRGVMKISAPLCDLNNTPLSFKQQTYTETTTETTTETSTDKDTRPFNAGIKNAFVFALAEVTGLDSKLNYGRLAKDGKKYHSAGYTPDQIITAFGKGSAWYSQHWKGKKGEKPSTSDVMQNIKDLLSEKKDTHDPDEYVGGELSDFIEY